MPPSPLIRLASCRNLVKCSWNILRLNSVRYTTCSDVVDSSSGTSHPLEKVGKFKGSNETLYQLKRERSSALIFLNLLDRKGFKHDLETYMTVVRLLCRWDWGIDASSNDLLNDVIDNTDWKVDWKVESSNSISHDLFEALMEENLIKAVEVLVQVYASAGKFDEGIFTLFEMKNRGGRMVSTETCNFVMKELIKQDKVEMVESFYRQLKKSGFILNVHTYGLVIKGLCMEGSLKEAGKVFEHMEKAGVEPDAFAYNTYIHGLCCKGKTELAFQLVKDLKESNQPVDDVFAYSCVIQGFVKEMKIEDANDAFLDMKLRGVVPDRYCYGVLIGGYCKKGNTSKSLALCKQMDSRGIKTDDVTVRWMMQYLYGCGMFRETLYVFKHSMQQSGVVLDEFSFNFAIGVACKLGKTEDALRLVEEMKSRKIEPVMQPLASDNTGFQDQLVHPNVNQDGGVEDARDQAAMCYVRQLRTSLQNLAQHKLNSLYAPDSMILKSSGSEDED